MSKKPCAWYMCPLVGNDDDDRSREADILLVTEMGCDGYTVPFRKDMIVKKKGKEKLDPALALQAKWQLCALSKEPLAEPIVCDRLGTLFNKDAVLQAMVGKTLPEEFAHIKSLRDLQACKLTANPEAGGEDEDAAAARAAYLCPVTRVEMTGKQRFCLVRGCGCVVSERALRELRVGAAASADKAVCPACSAALPTGGVYVQPFIVLNGSAEDVSAAREAMDAETAAFKQQRKDRKGRKKQDKRPRDGDDARAGGKRARDE